MYEPCRGAISILLIGVVLELVNRREGTPISPHPEHGALPASPGAVHSTRGFAARAGGPIEESVEALHYRRAWAQPFVQVICIEAIDCGQHACQAKPVHRSLAISAAIGRGSIKVSPRLLGQDHRRPRLVGQRSRRQDRARRVHPVPGSAVTHSPQASILGLHRGSPWVSPVNDATGVLGIGELIYVNRRRGNARSEAENGAVTGSHGCGISTPFSSAVEISINSERDPRQRRVAVRPSLEVIARPGSRGGRVADQNSVPGNRRIVTQTRKLGRIGPIHISVEPLGKQPRIHLAAAV